MNMEKELLNILRDNARTSLADIAKMMNSDEKTVAEKISELEKNKTIKGYTTIVDEAVVDEGKVRAIIEVKVTPEREGGFDKVAKRISRFGEVSAVYLVSGGYDLQLEVIGETLHDVALFVASKLSPIEGVTSTATHFLLKKYKESGQLLHDGEEYERLQVAP